MSDDLDRKLNSRFYQTYINQDDYEDLREAYDRLLAKMVRLVESAKDLLNAITVLYGDEYSCFSTCSLANECDKDSGNECLLVARLKAALGGEE